MRDAWALALETLCNVELRKLNERLALNRTANQLGITDANALRIAYGLVIEAERRLNVIDEFINSVVKPKKMGEFSFPVQAFLRLYVYQTRTRKNWAEPDFEEAKRIAKMGRALVGWKNLRPVEQYLGFLLSGQIGSVMKKVADEQLVALRTFHPVWFVDYCFRLFGRSEALAFLEGNIDAPSTFVRLNTLRSTKEEILATLDSESVKLEKTEPLKHVYKVIECKKPLMSFESYKEGLFYVQGKGSCFAVEAADPKPGMMVLDVCAAPGAKTSYFAQLMQNQGIIYSVDFSPRRMKTWKQEIHRTGVSVAESLIADSRGSLPLNVEADVVLLDPPCTSTGDFGRQPSAKWRLTSKSAESMAEIQWQIMNNCAKNVKPGGILLYTTCSVTVEENEMIIDRFLKWNPEFSLEEIDLQLGCPGLRGLTKCRRLYPHLHESNGTFVAKLIKG